MLNTQYNPQNRIDKALDKIAESLGSDDVVKGVYPLPLKKIADTVEGIAAKIEADGGLYAKVPTRICGSDDYDHETGEPTIENPEENVFYLVPSTSTLSDDMFDEWVYVNGGWERFGSGGSLNIPQADWNETDTTSAAYIKNKPAYANGVDF